MNSEYNIGGGNHAAGKHKRKNSQNGKPVIILPHDKISSQGLKIRKADLKLL